MKVLVIGGAGFIGSHVTARLCEKRQEVSVFDDLSTGYEDNLDKRAKLIKANLSDRQMLDLAVEGKDAIIHLAAESIIEDSIRDPERTLKRNINYAINILEAMRKNNVKHIVFASSAAVYGEPAEEKLIKEESIKKPLQAYGSSKIAIEKILLGYYNSFGINSVSLRFFNAYGPRDDMLPVRRAVPRWIKAVILNRPVELFWKGEQIRDYIYAGDIAEAHLAVLGKPGCHQYNIGSGKGTKVKEILEAVFKAAGKRVKVIDAGERKGDPNFLVADISKIEREIGWKPKVGLEEGMKETYKFYKNNIKSLERIDGV